MATDEHHIRQALDCIYTLLADCYPDSDMNDALYRQLRKHIDAIRVKGDAKREARADGAAE